MSDGARESMDILVTNERRSEHQLVLVRGRPAWLTAGGLRLLLKLIAGRRNNDGGYLPECAVCYPVAVCRLRRKLERAGRGRRGKALVESGSGREYRIKPDARVAVERAFLAALRRSDPGLASELEQAGVDSGGEAA